MPICPVAKITTQGTTGDPGRPGFREKSANGDNGKLGKIKNLTRFLRILSIKSSSFGINWVIHMAAQFFIVYTKTYYMKKLSIIVAMLTVIGVTISSCSAGAHIGTKHHSVSAGTQAH
jgi:hypothetical protein